MADITMCMDMSCSEKLSCYRYNAPANPHRQSYFVKSPRDTEGSCTSYWKMEDKDENRVGHRNKFSTRQDTPCGDQRH